MTVYVWGMGKAGLCLALVIAESGQNVIGVDVDKKRVSMLNKGMDVLEGQEEGLAELLNKNLGKNFKAITSEEYTKQVKLKKELEK